MAFEPSPQVGLRDLEVCGEGRMPTELFRRVGQYPLRERPRFDFGPLP